MEMRIRVTLTHSPHWLTPTTLARRLDVPKAEIDRALSKMGAEVSWTRMGRGGGRLYRLNRGSSADK